MSHPHVIHRDDVEPAELGGADIAARRWPLGAAAGTRRVGLSRYLIAPGARNMPLHVHGDEEEITCVLAGAGWCVEDDTRFAIAAGDCVVHRPGGAAHTLFAGDAELDVLIFGSGSDSGLGWLPRAGVMWAGPRWLPADAKHPFAAEADAGPLDLPPEVPRPPHVVRGAPAGGAASGLRQLTVEPGVLSAEPHWHTMEEELLVVLEGDGTVILGGEEHPLRPGSVVARPPGSGVAHALRAGEGGLTCLAYGTRVPGDCVFHPGSNTVLIGGTMFRVTPVDDREGKP